MNSTEPCALITGGLSGIGLAAAIMLAGRGIHVAVASTRVGTPAAKDAEAQLAAAASGSRGKSQQIDIRIRQALMMVLLPLPPIWDRFHTCECCRHLQHEAIDGLVMLNGKTRLPAI